MKKGRLSEIIDQISRRDLREIGKCVRSPFFNTRDYVADLFDFILECRENLKIKPTNEQLHAHIFPSLVFSDSRIRSAMSLLVKIIERYLAIRTIEQKPAAMPLALAEAYRKLNLQKHYDQTIRTAEEILKNEPDRPADYYSNLYSLEFEKYRSLSARRQLDEVNLQAVSDKLDDAYLAQKLKQTCFSISHRRMYTREYDLGLLPHLLEVASAERYQKTPAISLYYHGYFALTQSNEEFHFKKFKEQLIAFGNEFPRDELRDLYLLATNYCIKRVNEDAPHFADEALDLYKEALRKKVLQTNGILSHITFSNITAIGLLTEDFSFTENFLNDYKSALSGEYREPIFSFNLARLEYQRGDFDKALDLLRREVYRDLLLNLSVKTVTAKIYFEIKEFDLLFSHLDAMQQFIRRKKVMGYHRENFQNFLSLLRKIVEMPDFAKAEKITIKKEIEGVKSVAERRWLLKQL